VFTSPEFQESALRRRMVQELVDWFYAQGWAVAHATLEGYERPPAQGRHAPDAMAMAEEGIWRIGTVRTGEGDLDTPCSREQYEDFAFRVMAGTENLCPLYIAVPREYEPELRLILADTWIAELPHVHILPWSRSASFGQP
jgi:hypothetical protein